MRKPVFCSSCNVEACPILKNCSQEWINILAENKHTSYYQTGQNIVYENNPVMGLFFIYDGVAKIFSTGINNKTQVVRLTKTGGIIGHRGLGGEKYPIGATALTDCTICFIDNKVIYEAFMQNPKLTFDLMMYYSKELRNSENKIKNLAQMNVREKVADGLIYVNKVFNENTNNTSFSISRKDLADLVGINTQQLSRTLSEFKKEQLIIAEQTQIELLNLKVLNDLLLPFKYIY